MAVQGGAIMDDGPLGGAAPAKVVGADAAGNEEPAESKSPKKPKATAASLEDGAAKPDGVAVAKDKKKGGAKGAAKGAAKGGEAALKVAKKGGKGRIANVKKRPAGAMELKRKPAAAVKKGKSPAVADDSGDVSDEPQEVDPGGQKEEDAIVPKGARGGGVAQPAGELALVPVAKHRDVMKSRNFHSLWRSNSLPEEAKVLVDQMDEERQRGAW